ncbi:MAG: M24 family metallopeptidase [Deltaproteobacteria bacterium]|nr:M24 family metallopeptidase [Deltaproteobacteria bacterium]
MQFPSYYHLVPPDIIAARVARTAGLAAEAELAWLLFTHRVDVYYLSGSMMQGAVAVSAAGEAVYHVRRDVERARAESSLWVEAVAGFGQVAQALAPGLPPGARLGMPLDVTSAAAYLGWQKRLPGVEVVDISRPWLELMGVKDAWEAARLAATGALAARVYALIPGLLTEGLSEIALAAQLMAAATAQGGLNLMRVRAAYNESYTWHIVAGPQGAMPGAIDAPFTGLGLAPGFPQGASHRPIGRGDPVNVDFGVCLEGYHTDQTRTYTIGPAPTRVKEAHACLETIDQALAQRLTPGAVSGELHQLALDLAAEAGMADYFLGSPGRKIRFTGHGLGLELGTPPYLMENSPAQVRAGEAYALELKMVLPEGPVGLENTFLVNPSGPPTWLTPMPNKLVEI